jgi:DNA-binding HxlR family transcriptional regulator
MKQQRSLEPKALRPGEIKILNALKSGPKINKQLKEKTKLNKNFLSLYLKTLQKSELVGRNIDRQYYIKNKILSEEMLYFNDIALLIQDQIKKSLTDQKERNQEFFYDYWTGDTLGFITVNKKSAFDSAFLEKLKAALKEPEKKQAFRTVAKIVKTEWRAYVLSFKMFSENERKIIDQWDKTMAELLTIIYSHLSKKGKELFNNDEIMRSEKGNQLWLDPSNSNPPSESEKKRVNEILDFLYDPKNLKIYSKYDKKMREAPKTLIVYSLLGYAFYQYKEYKKQLDNLLSIVRELNIKGVEKDYIKSLE